MSVNNVMIVNKKSVYGNDLVYPISDNAIAMCKLLGVKTFTDHSISQLKAMGYTFQLQQAIQTI